MCEAIDRSLPISWKARVLLLLGASLVVLTTINYELRYTCQTVHLVPPRWLQWLVVPETLMGCLACRSQHYPV